MSLTSPFPQKAKIPKKSDRPGRPVAGGLSLLFASGCYLGMIPGAPGTYGSVATTVLFYGVNFLAGTIRPELHLSAVCLITVMGVLAADRVSRDRNSEDPQIVVVDEAAGQLVSFLLLPVTPMNLLLGTALFRLFDMWKPFPIRKLERLKNGVGIMADDLLAGVYANLVLQAVGMAMRQFGFP